jgi:hypothetical protein
MDDLEIADYEILQRVYRSWDTNILPPPKETPDEYQARIMRMVHQKELKEQFRVVLRKLRKAIVGE